MMIDPGNISPASPYTLAGRSGALTGTLAAGTGTGAASNCLFAMRNIGKFNDVGTLMQRAIGVSRIRTGFVARSIPTATVAVLSLQMHKVSGMSALPNVASSSPSLIARNRKTSGYQVIPNTEVAGRISNDTALGTGTWTAADPDEPFEMLMAQASPMDTGATLLGITASSVWTPADLQPYVLENNEGLILFPSEDLVLGIGVGRLFVAVDFFFF